MNSIPYGTQYLDQEDIDAVTEVLKSDYLTTGPMITEFETKLCEAMGANYAVAVSSGTAALHLSAITSGLGVGDEVIVSPLTFAASANCALYVGARPVFADIAPDTLLMNIEDVQRKITRKTKAIVCVHYGGELCDMDAYKALAKKYSLRLIQDAAHSLGGTIRGKAQGGYPGMQVWSFHPVKTITTGEGGAVTTNDEVEYKTLLRLRSHGITRDTGQYSHQEAGEWYYEMLDLGFNYRITDIQCAIGVSQLRKLPQFAKRRAEIVNQYNEAFAKLPVQLQASPSWSDAVRHIYTIRVADPVQRRTVFDSLRANGIGVNVHYIPVYWHPYYEKLGYVKGLCPNAEDAYSRLITLPLYPALKEDQVTYVIKSVENAVS